MIFNSIFYSVPSLCKHVFLCDVSTGFLLLETHPAILSNNSISIKSRSFSMGTHVFEMSDIYHRFSPPYRHFPCPRLDISSRTLFGIITLIWIFPNASLNDDSFKSFLIAQKYEKFRCHPTCFTLYSVVKHISKLKQLVPVQKNTNGIFL